MSRDRGDVTLTLSRAEASALSICASSVTEYEDQLESMFPNGSTRAAATRAVAKLNAAWRRVAFAGRGTLQVTGKGQ